MPPRFLQAMRILFCNDSFPGHFEPLAAYFASDPANEVLFASRYERRAFSIPGVRRVQFRAPKERNAVRDPLINDWAKAADLGRKALESFLQIRNIGFTPDIVLYSAGNGVSLFLERAFPDAFRAAYLDNSVNIMAEEADSRTIALMVQGLSLFESHRAYAFSTKQRDAFPPILRPSIGIIPLSVNTEFFNREAASPFFCNEEEKVAPKEMVSFSIKGEVSIGLLRVIAALLARRQDCHAMLSCGTAQNAKLIRHAMAGLGPERLSRLHICDFLQRSTYRDMLCSSAVHVCPQRTNTLLVEHLEAMSSGPVLMTPAPASPLALKPGNNMAMWPDKPQDQFNMICRLLDNEQVRKQIAAQARQTVLSG
ncbi:MAG: hypothetical protein J6I40_06755, partial [Mailhella sp.]|nr:hypothetical protein [Mailhella sp.]